MLECVESTSSRHRRVRTGFFLLTALAALTGLPMRPTAAQDLDNVTISGKVTDQNGAVIPGATVTAKLVDTKVERTAVTDGDGIYKIIQLAPGKYTLTAAANSFQTTVESGLEFVAGRNAQIDLILFPPGLKLDAVVITTEDASPVDVTRT